MARRNNRRDFLKAGAGAGIGFWATAGLTEVRAAQAANEKLNIAIIGAGGRGAANLSAVAGENIVALCDADEARAADAYRRYQNVPKYSDYRVMLEKQKDIDAVVVSTPDHNHAPASIMAMRMGKHCYCEKPLTHSVHEARMMKEVAARQKVATQMGNQGTATSGLRQGAEIVRSGALGEVREVHVWTNRPIWPQNIGNPRLGEILKGQPVPKTLNWDTWLGPAPQRSYHQAYVPFNWRGWWDFGTGALGDMGCHTVNLPFMALRLGAPSSVQADVEGEINPETGPLGCTVTFEFPARGDLPACRLMWYERRLPRPELLMGQKASGSGCLIVGTKGTMYSPSDYGSEHRLMPEANFQGYRPPEPSIPRSPGHHAEWIRACKGGAPAMSNFVDYSAQLTETILLGNVAMRVGQRIVWDSEKLRAVGCPQADQYIRREYRKGWTL